MAAPANPRRDDAAPANPRTTDPGPVDPEPVVRVREVTPARWPDFERLFESRGGPKSCWCMHFRRDESGRTPRAKENRRRAMAARIQGGTRVGLLAYDAADEPVAWCSVAPRETLVNHGGLEQPDEDPATVWSITCFYVKSGIRRRGVMGRLIEEAVAHARRNGGSVVEAYPVAPDSPSYLFCGWVPVFEAHGFVEVGRAGLRRHVMRRASPPVSSPPPALPRSPRP